MYVSPNPRGPDVAIVGTARSGTTALAAALGRHRDIDLAAMKEPNYFSAAWANGPEWYDSLFAPRRPSSLRLDASTTYTYADQPAALDRLVTSSPKARLIYVVREPVARAFSQWVHDTIYLHGQRGADFADAIRRPLGPLATSRYDATIERMDRLVGADRLLVVPFEAVRDDLSRTTSTIVRWLGLDLADLPTEVESDLHRNDRVRMRSRTFGRVFNWARDTKAWPHLRQAVGDDRMRRLKRLVTTSDGLPSLEETIDGLEPALRAELDATQVAATSAVESWLRRQDDALGLSWSERVAWLETSQA